MELKKPLQSERYFEKYYNNALHALEPDLYCQEGIRIKFDRRVFSCVLIVALILL